MITSFQKYAIQREDPFSLVNVVTVEGPYRMPNDTIWRVAVILLRDPKEREAEDELSISLYQHVAVCKDGEAHFLPTVCFRTNACLWLEFPVSEDTLSKADCFGEVTESERNTLRIQRSLYLSTAEYGATYKLPSNIVEKRKKEWEEVKWISEEVDRKMWKSMQ